MNDTDLSTIVWSLSNPSPTQRISRELSHIASRLPKIFTLGFVTIKLNLVKNWGSPFLLKFDLFPKFSSCQYY